MFFLILGEDPDPVTNLYKIVMSDLFMQRLGRGFDGLHGRAADQANDYQNGNYYPIINEPP